MAKKKLKIMTVCLANCARSPTAEWLLLPNYKVKSCGTAARATKPCDKWDMKWANKVVVMEPYQKQTLESRYPTDTRGKVINLNVPEIGEFGCEASLMSKIEFALIANGFKTRTIKNIRRAEDECTQWVFNMATRKAKGKRARSYVLPEYFPPEKHELEEAMMFPPMSMEEEEFRGYIPMWHIQEAEKMAAIERAERHREMMEREFDEKAERRRMDEKFSGETALVDELAKYADKVKAFFESTEQSS